MKRLNIALKSFPKVDWSDKEFLDKFMWGLKQINEYVYQNKQDKEFTDAMDWFRTTEPFKSLKLKSVRRVEKVQSPEQIIKLFDKGSMSMQQRDYWGGTRAKITKEIENVLISIRADTFPIVLITKYHNVWGLSIKTLHHLLKRDKKQIMVELDQEGNDWMDTNILHYKWLAKDENEVIFYKPMNKIMLNDIEYFYVSFSGSLPVPYTKEEFEEFLPDIEEIWDNF